MSSLQAVTVLVSFLCLIGSVSASTQMKTVGFSQNSPMYDLSPSSLTNGDEFGLRVSIWNDLAAVSSGGRKLNEELEVVSGGKVYLYRQQSSRNWKQLDTVLTSKFSGDGYGLSVCVRDEVIAVGAPYSSSKVEKGGLVYVYSSSSSSSSEINPDHLEKESLFGWSVAIVGVANGYQSGALVIGAPGHSHEDRHKVGAIFVFAKNYGSSTYVLKNMLEPADMHENGELGHSLSAFGNTIAAGAPGANTVHLFEMQKHDVECPPDRHDAPEECSEYYRRYLQAGPDDRDHHVVTQWRYQEVLAIGVDGHHEGDDNMMFGQSVSVYNDTVLSVVIGAPGTDAKSSSGGTLGDAGAVYILTLLNKNDLWANFRPEGYEDHGPEDHHHDRWNPMELAVGVDRTDNFWLREKVIYGGSAAERLGHAVACDYHYCFAGADNEKAFGQGEVTIHQRVTSTSVDYDKPVISGPLFKKSWSDKGTLTDSNGNNGDKFGSALSLYKNTVIVGSYLKGINSATNVGTGGAYIYDQIKVFTVTPSPTPSPVSQPASSSATSTSSSASKSSMLGKHIDSAKALQIAIGGTVILFIALIGVYGVYKYRGGKTQATKVFKASWDSMKEFGGKLKFWDKSKQRVNLSKTMDESTSSVTPMNMDDSSGSFSSSNSSGSSYGRPKPYSSRPPSQSPHGGMHQPPQQRSYAQPQYSQRPGQGPPNVSPSQPQGSQRFPAPRGPPQPRPQPGPRYSQPPPQSRGNQF